MEADLEAQMEVSVLDIIIAQNPLFANAKREVFAQMLRFGLAEHIALVELCHLIRHVDVDFMIDFLSYLFRFI